VIRREAAGSNDAVDVRMKLQSLIPSVKHTEETDLGTEMPWIAPLNVAQLELPLQSPRQEMTAGQLGPVVTANRLRGLRPQRLTDAGARYREIFLSCRPYSSAGE
jgi:hypothetical protein